MDINGDNIISQTYHHFMAIIELDTIRMAFCRWEVTESELKYIISKFRARKVNSFVWIGKYKGFDLEINDFAITITGSPSNYFNGKANTLPYIQFYDAIDKLSSELGINLHSAKLYRVDVNWNYSTKELIESYTRNLFLDLSKFKRIERDAGVLFYTKSKAVDIYNKTQYFKSKKIANDMENWLRIEFRILKDVKKILGFKYVKDLYEPDNYKKLLLEFRKHYHNILKQTLPVDNVLKLKSVKEYRKLSILRGILMNGGFSSAFREIEQISKMGVFKNSNQKYRLRQELKDCLKNPNINTPHPLITELNTQFDLDISLELNKLNNFGSIQNS
ncbi:hypothetical protein [Aequorivita echinoideorum]|uniref:Phage/plasmid replication protein, gene II/X family n=1 Tax=Aequorivita echinoideorum TaxID=1549647 RepID=A0ABS5S0T7_9FLAO|nr:hypothetical protein [Aequorivita echinoideorum]MBT0606831.1 hypothetical protein [Aequorivita echinoideorum]